MVKERKAGRGSWDPGGAGENVHHEVGDVSRVWGLSKPVYAAGFYFKCNGAF